MTTTMTAVTCATCAADDWQPLPDVGQGRSVTTAGRILDEPLAKAHCRRCGLGQRVGAPLLASTDFYERRYSFYERPGAARFDRRRYAAMAEWIRAAVPFAPRRILDAGCGRGWMLEAIRDVFPESFVSGIEPSEAESENARRLGFVVTTGRVGRCAVEPAYDLVYSTNVLEHTDDPVKFLEGVCDALAPGGRIVIICPDGSHPGAELLFSDQNFSLLPAHLETLAAQGGLEVERWEGPASGVTSLRDKQLVVLAPSAGASRQPPMLAASETERLYAERLAYCSAWWRVGERLEAAARAAHRVYHFGTSTWSFLIAGYCRTYWALVTSCMIDGGAGEFLGRPVVDAGSVSLEPGDVVVIGVDPDMQEGLAARYRSTPAAVVTWNDIVRR